MLHRLGPSTNNPAIAIGHRLHYVKRPMNEPALPRPDHRAHPLRKIVRREVQDGRHFVLLVCRHVVPGIPASRTSRFYPCPECGEDVERYRRMYEGEGQPVAGP